MMTTEYHFLKENLIDIMPMDVIFLCIFIWGVWLLIKALFKRKHNEIIKESDTHQNDQLTNTQFATEEIQTIVQKDPHLMYFFEKTLGIIPDAIGWDTIDAIIRKRINPPTQKQIERYLYSAIESHEEQCNLLKDLAINETWFFRNGLSFSYLNYYIKQEWWPDNPGEKLHILSIPCSTGEEPYSIAMTLLESGLPHDHFTIDAMDIHPQAIDIAQKGHYYEKSFRGGNMAFKTLFFNNCDYYYQLKDHVICTVRFIQGNILQDKHKLMNQTYHIIFCRNLLIYLSAYARQNIVKTIFELLDDDGILFAGHSEWKFFCEYGFERIKKSGVFACKKKSLTQPSMTVPQDILNIKILNHDIKKDVHQSQEISIPIDESNQPTKIVHDKQKDNNKFDIAQQLASNGQLMEAIAMFDAVLKIEPTHIDAWFLSALCYLEQDQLQEAEKIFQKVIYLDPSHEEALMHLSWLKENAGQHKQAELYRKRLFKLKK